MSQGRGRGEPVLLPAPNGCLRVTLANHPVTRKSLRLPASSKVHKGPHYLDYPLLGHMNIQCSAPSRCCRNWQVGTKNDITTSLVCHTVAVVAAASIMPPIAHRVAEDTCAWERGDLRTR